MIGMTAALKLTIHHGQNSGLNRAMTVDVDTRSIQRIFDDGVYPLTIGFRPFLAAVQEYGQRRIDLELTVAYPDGPITRRTDHVVYHKDGKIIERKVIESELSRILSDFKALMVL